MATSVSWERCDAIRAALEDFPGPLRDYFEPVEDPETDEVYLVPKDGVRLWRFPVVLSALPAPVKGFQSENPMEIFWLETPSSDYLFTIVEDDFGVLYIYNLHRLKQSIPSSEEADHA